MWGGSKMKRGSTLIWSLNLEDKPPLSYQIKHKLGIQEHCLQSGERSSFYVDLKAYIRVFFTRCDRDYWWAQANRSVNGSWQSFPKRSHYCWIWAVLMQSSCLIESVTLQLRHFWISFAEKLSLSLHIRSGKISVGAQQWTQVTFYRTNIIFLLGLSALYYTAWVFLSLELLCEQHRLQAFWCFQSDWEFKDISFLYLALCMLIQLKAFYESSEGVS